MNLDFGLNNINFSSIFSITEEKSTDVRIKINCDDEESTKSQNSRLRWNLVFNLLLLCFIPLPIWLPYVSSEGVAVNLLIVIQIMFMACWLTVSFLSWVTYGKLWRAKNKMFEMDDFQQEHLIVVSAYKEPVSLLMSTIKTIEIQKLASSHINLTLSFEERTPELSDKITEISDRFLKKFKRIFFTVHPYNQPGEIPGKCSNANFGIRSTVAQLDDLGVDTNNLIITTCDADTKFHPSFFNALTETFKNTKNPHESVFQSPLLYNWKLDEANVVTRVTGIMRSTLMMGVMIPFNINTMSIFSFSGKLCKAGNFIHPSYQMDDIIALIRQKFEEICLDFNFDFNIL